MYDDLKTLTVRNDAGVLCATIHNPPVNVLSLQVAADLSSLADMAWIDPAVRVIVLDSADPDFFIAHFEAALVIGAPEEPHPVRYPELTHLHALCAKFRDNPKPSLVKMAGRAGGGGCEFAASCDMRFGVRGKTILNQMEVALGIIPGGSGCQNWVRHVGRGRALEVILGCDDIDCDTARDWGYLNRVFDDVEAMNAFVDRLAARIALWPPHSVALAKQSVDVSDQRWRSDLLEEAFLCRQALTSPDARPLLRRFVELGAETREGETRIAEVSLEAARSYFQDRRSRDQGLSV